jgi:ribosome biogenesis GTPase
LADSRITRLADGLVVQAGSGVFDVPADLGMIVCTIRGRSRLGRDASRSLRGLSDHALVPVVGDRTLVTIFDRETGVIEAILPRHNRFSRKVAGRRHDERIIAANIDQVVVVFAAAEPSVRETALTRYLAVAEHSGVPAVVCINKTDLVPRGSLEQVAGAYESLGYAVILASTRTQKGIGELTALLMNKISVVVGPSGVGKSLLLNAVQPGLGLAVGDVSKSTGKGKHTTTSSRLYPLDSGGFVADTAGMREFGFWDIPEDELTWCFREMGPFLGRCRFADCTHVTEPGCAIRGAVSEGAISENRYRHCFRLRVEG